MIQTARSTKGIPSSSLLHQYKSGRNPNLLETSGNFSQAAGLPTILAAAKGAAAAVYPGVGPSAE